MARETVVCLFISTWMIASMGCASAPQKTFGDKVAQARRSLDKVNTDISFSPTGENTQDSLDKAFADMMTACQGTLGRFEREGRGWGVTKVAIATLGTIAGAIVVPAFTAAAASANAVWISAFGGFSGAANAAQQAFSDVGFTPTNVLQTRQRVLDDWTRATTDYFNSESSPEKKKLSIQKGLTACTLYAITVPGLDLSAPSTEKGATQQSGQSAIPK